MPSNCTQPRSFAPVRPRLAAAVAVALCAVAPLGTAAAETGDEFVARLNKQFADISLELNAAGWTQATYITVDTQLLSARANERFLAAFSQAVDESRQFDGKPMSPASRRSIDLLRQGVSAPAPNDPAKRAELATIMARMEAKYGEAKYCRDGGKDCRDEVQLKTVLEQSRDYDELLDAWRGWHDQARGLRPDYIRFVELANEGARELGFKDVGAMWRSGYDMPADEFTKEAARLYKQVEPLYKDLQCYARGKLAAKYGEDKVPAGKPIP
ncbi:MAG: hypothetical protein RL261_490, partial [Pseudomonadota bacterium]